jgi:hypothetical protein
MKRAFLSAVASTCVLLSAPTARAQLATNPIALWSFDEASGTTALDSSGNNHSATATGAIYVTRRSNTCLSFNGSNSYAFIPDISAGGTTGAGLDMGARDWTVAAWINTTNSGTVVTKMGYVGGSNPDGWGLSISGNGTVGAVLHKSNVAAVNIFTGDGKLVNDRQWHHVAVVFNRAGNMIRYVDGAASGAQYSLASLNGQSLDNATKFTSKVSSMTLASTRAHSAPKKSPHSLASNLPNHHRGQLPSPSLMPMAALPSATASTSSDTPAAISCTATLRTTAQPGALPPLLQQLPLTTRCNTAACTLSATPSICSQPQAT